MRALLSGTTNWKCSGCCICYVLVKRKNHLVVCDSITLETLNSSGTHFLSTQKVTYNSYREYMC